jgi:hypothetical protein
MRNNPRNNPRNQPRSLARGGQLGLDGACARTAGPNAALRLAATRTADGRRAEFVLVDCLTHQGLLAPQRRRAAVTLLRHSSGRSWRWSANCRPGILDLAERPSAEVATVLGRGRLAWRRVRWLRPAKCQQDRVNKMLRESIVERLAGHEQPGEQRSRADLGEQCPIGRRRDIPPGSGPDSLDFYYQTIGTSGWHAQTVAGTGTTAG